MKYLLDTSAWIELFEGTEKGEVVRHLVKKKNATIITADASFAEIFSWAIRTDKLAGDAIAYARHNSKVYEVYTNIWLEGAAFKEKLRKTKKDFGLIDGLILAIQKVTGATIVTGDPHFKGMKKVVML